MKVCPPIAFPVCLPWWRLFLRRRRRSVMLSWDGENWIIDGCPVGWPVVALDLQQFVLLALRRPEAQVIWALARCDDAPLDWLRLRRALYSRATAGRDQRPPSSRLTGTPDRVQP